MIHLEIIAASLEDARAAYAGGATRLEVVFRLDTGGLTPAIELAAQIAQSVPIPARIMLRENEGFEITGAEELERLKSKARALAELNVDGLVVGFTKNGRLDAETLRQII